MIDVRLCEGRWRRNRNSNGVKVVRGRSVEREREPASGNYTQMDTSGPFQPAVNLCKVFCARGKVANRAQERFCGRKERARRSGSTKRTSSPER